MSANFNCLVVDDSDVIRKVMRTIIEGVGVAVEDCATTEAAMARCRMQLPDVIVLDWHIPGSKPLEFVSALRAHALGNRIKILYVVTDQDANELATARAAGVNEIMMKPFHRVQLEAKVLGFLTQPRDLEIDLAAHRPLMRGGHPASIHAFRAVIDA